MIKKLITYIEQEPWDEVMLRQERYLNRAIFIVLILAAIYFAPAVIKILTR